MCAIRIERGWRKEEPAAAPDPASRLGGDDDAHSRERLLLYITFSLSPSHAHQYTDITGREDKMDNSMQ